ncbi:MAG: hypothetical protein AAFY41_10535 [Bacteroidota bacterium]
MNNLLDTFRHESFELLIGETDFDIVYEWIDLLYEAEFVEKSRHFPIELFTISALREYIQAHPLEAEYQQKFDAIAELTICNPENKAV